MKTFVMLLVVPALMLTMQVGCSRTVSHTETSHPNLLGGQTNTEQTVTQNPDGSYSTERSKTSVH